MLEQRVIEWINAEIDGELSPEDQASLQAVLDTSAEARAMKVELQRLSNLLDNVPQVAPPQGLSAPVIDQLATRPTVSGFSLADWFQSFQPATAGLGFAAGLLATVVFFELSTTHDTQMDSASMVGTMVAGDKAQGTALDTLRIEQNGLSGNITLQERGNILVLNFDLDSAQTTEIEISLAEAGLSFGGIAHAPGSGNDIVDSIEVSGGDLRVVKQGRQAFSIFLSNAARDSGRGKELSIGISTGGAQVYTGVLRA